MLHSKILTHKPGKTYDQPHFFILNKGNNSGRPMSVPCPNCFVFLAEDEQDRDFHYFAFLGLWELKSFRPHIIGSVIPFIRKSNLIEVAEPMLISINSRSQHFAKVQESISALEENSAILRKQLDLMTQMRKAYYFQFFKTS